MRRPPIAIQRGYPFNDRIHIPTQLMIVIICLVVASREETPDRVSSLGYWLGVCFPIGTRGAHCATKCDADLTACVVIRVGKMRACPNLKRRSLRERLHATFTIRLHAIGVRRIIASK